MRLSPRISRGRHEVGEELAVAGAPAGHGVEVDVDGGDSEGIAGDGECGIAGLGVVNGDACEAIICDLRELGGRTVRAKTSRARAAVLTKGRKSHE
jgi:hypothetical protein